MYRINSVVSVPCKVNCRWLLPARSPLSGSGIACQEQKFSSAVVCRNQVQHQQHPHGSPYVTEWSRVSRQYSEIIKEDQLYDSTRLGAFSQTKALPKLNQKQRESTTEDVLAEILAASTEKSTNCEQQQATSIPPKPAGSQSIKAPDGCEPPPGDNSGGSKALTALGFLFGAGCGVIGYAAYNDEFRKNMENQPVIGPVFKGIPACKATVKGLFQSNDDRCDDSTTKSLIPSKQLESSGPVMSPEVQKALEEEEKRREHERRRKDAEDMARREKAKHSADSDVENATLEVLLKTSMEECVTCVHSAVEAEKAAVDATKAHSEELRKAMDITGEPDGIDGQWDVVIDSQKKKREALDKAHDNLTKAKDEIGKVSATIDDGKQNTITQKNKTLAETEKALANVKYELDSVVAELEKAEVDARIINRYRDLIKKGREQFKHELESITPSIRVGSAWGKLTEEDLNSLIAHAHRRIEQLQQQLFKQQAMEQQQVSEALSKQQQENTRLTEEAVVREREKITADLDVLKLEWEAQAQVQFEEEVKQHLTRQAAAHADHLTEVLSVQEKELTAKYTVLLEEKKMEERNRLYIEIGDHIARVKGIEAAVDARADKEKQTKKAQELWLACQSLNKSLEQGRHPNAKTWGESQLKPLSEELNAIKSASLGHPSVTVVLNAIPDEAKHRGVWTMDGLQKRFMKVSKTAKKVAMIPESGGSVFQYAVSHMRYYLVFPFSDKEYSENTVVDMNTLTTSRIIDMAGKLLREGKLEGAVRLMNQLRGQSRFVASDWIREARLLLETQQAADVLSTFASSRSIGGLE